jgi:hypothetical protein
MRNFAIPSLAAPDSCGGPDAIPASRANVSGCGTNSAVLSSKTTTTATTAAAAAAAATTTTTTTTNHHRHQHHHHHQTRQLVSRKQEGDIAWCAKPDPGRGGLGLTD